MRLLALLGSLLGIFYLSGGIAEASEKGRTPIADGIPERVRILKGNASVGLSVAFLPSGQEVVSSARRTTRFWNLESGEVVRQAPLR